MLECNKNYATLALNCVLKNSKKLYQYQKSREEIETIV